jgi:hypothetical protein
MPGSSPDLSMYATLMPRGERSEGDDIAGAFDHVILTPVAVEGSAVAQWASGGELNTTMKPLIKDLVSRYRVTHVLWHQGESDFAMGTDEALCKRDFMSFVASLRADGVDAPIYVSKATRCFRRRSSPHEAKGSNRPPLMAVATAMRSRRTSGFFKTIRRKPSSRQSNSGFARR